MKIVDNIKSDLKNNYMLGALFVVIFCIILSIVITWLSIESNIPSKGTNDGWLSYMGAIIGGILPTGASFFILFINRKDSEKQIKRSEELTRKIQEEHKKEFYYQLRKQFTDGIIDDIAIYVQDIQKYFFATMLRHTRGSECDDIKVDRSKSVEKFYLLRLKLSNLYEAKELVNILDKIHNKLCFYDSNSLGVKLQADNLNAAVEQLIKETKLFVENYLKNICKNPEHF